MPKYPPRPPTPGPQDWQLNHYMRKLHLAKAKPPPLAYHSDDEKPKKRYLKLR